MASKVHLCPSVPRGAVDAEDVALLRVSGTLPTAVQPLPLGSSLGTEGHLLVTFGYPDAGVSHATHLFNRMLGSSAREPGTVGAVLESDAVAAEIVK